MHPRSRPPLDLDYSPPVSPLPLVSPLRPAPAARPRPRHGERRRPWSTSATKYQIKEQAHDDPDLVVVVVIVSTEGTEAQKTPSSSSSS
uniref:Uncharacterized protein n=1 Tax=Arundo donax TaxID=35708 RepID=A0A0A9CBL2_ARUDO